MSQSLQQVRMLALSLSFVGAIGCTDINRIGDKMDIVSTRVEAPGQATYEGQLEMAKRIGDMTSLQFADGKFFDVADAPRALMHGDLVRIYKTDKGYEARLWKANDNPTVATGLSQAPATHTGS